MPRTENQMREAAGVRENAVEYSGVYVRGDQDSQHSDISTRVSERDRNRRGGSAIAMCNEERLDPILVMASADDGGEGSDSPPGA